MKPDPVEQELRELAWRRPLTAAEQARLAEWLEGHPEACANWAADGALNDALARLPEKPAPSNLTARVLAELDRDATQERASQRTWLTSFRWLPRVAVAVVVIGGAAFWYQQRLATEEAEALARQQAEALARLATVAEPDTMPTVEALEDFDVILKIHPESLVDTELLSMSKQLAEFQQ